MIESVNVHEDIKLGLPTRDRYIENYKQTLRNLKEIGVKVVCYNFMPVFDWTRSDLAKVLPDGSNALSYDQSVIDKITDPQKMADEIQKDSGGFEMPGWEPERMAPCARNATSKWRFIRTTRRGIFSACPVSPPTRKIWSGFSVLWTANTMA